MTYEGDEPNTHGQNQQTGDPPKIMTGESLFRLSHGAFFAKRRAVMQEMFDKYPPGQFPDHMITAGERAGMLATKIELGAGGTIGGLSVYLAGRYLNARRGLRGTPRGTIFASAAAMIAGAALFTLTDVGSFFHDEDVKGGPLNLERDCPAYLMLENCAKRQDCVDAAQKLGDKFRLLEGYNACVNRAVEENSGAFPSGSAGFPTGSAGFPTGSAGFPTGSAGFPTGNARFPKT